MNNIFLISSAVGNDYGVFSYQERLAQLLETIKSIKKYAIDDDIVLVDASENILPDTDIQTLKNLVTDVIFLNDHPQVSKQKNVVPSDKNLTGKKTVGELCIFVEFLKYLKQKKKQYKRVFKISGRYKLNEDFNIDHHYVDNKIVFLSHDFWGENPIYNTRLWSFDYSLLNQLTNLFTQIYLYTFNKIEKEHMIQTLEFSLYKYIHLLGLEVYEIPVLGVQGVFGQDANPLKE